MFKSIVMTTIISVGLYQLVSCQSPKQSTAIVVPKAPVVTQCKDPRSPICTKEYRPVCATRDTGVRCVTTPCPSTEKVTKSNACTACADVKVFDYVAGACS